MKRKHVSFKTKFACALAQMMHEVDGKLELILTHAEAKLLTEDQIISLFQLDHDPIPHAEGGSDEFWNLVPKLIAAHRIKTKNDVKVIAKTKRISKQQEEFRNRLLTPRDERPPRQSRWASRPFAKRGKLHETK